MFQVKNLTKKYEGFTLDNVSFSLPEGLITGFVGANGAGKSTTMRAMLGIVKPDGGSVSAFGFDMATDELEIKRRVAFSAGGFEYYPYEKALRVKNVYREFYPSWNEKTYRGYLEKFGINDAKRVRDFSSGMKVKFSLALALSHDAEVIVLDEPTSGLDPIARDELGDILREIVSDGKKSVMFSTHITSDLDKCADRILLIANGRLMLDEDKDAAIENHLLVHGGADELTDELRKKAIGIKENEFGFTALVRREKDDTFEDFSTETPNLEDLTVFYSGSVRV